LALTALALFAVPLWASEPTRIATCLTPTGERGLDAPILSGLGKLMPATHEPMPGWDTGPLPQWQVRLGDRTYPLVFGCKSKFAALAAQHRGEWVKIRGRLEQRHFTLVRAASPD